MVSGFWVYSEGFIPKGALTRFSKLCFSNRSRVLRIDRHAIKKNAGKIPTLSVENIRYLQLADIRAIICNLCFS